jgi:hypothetical protein
MKKICKNEIFTIKTSCCVWPIFSKILILFKNSVLLDWWNGFLTQDTPSMLIVYYKYTNQVRVAY